MNSFEEDFLIERFIIREFENRKATQKELDENIDNEEYILDYSALENDIKEYINMEMKLEVVGYNKKTYLNLYAEDFFTRALCSNLGDIYLFVFCPLSFKNNEYVVIRVINLETSELMDIGHSEEFRKHFSKEVL